MEWVNLIDNAIDKIKKDGRDPNASEFLDLKAFVNSSGEHWGALMHNFGNNLVIDDDGEVNFPFWLVRGYHADVDVLGFIPMAGLSRRLQAMHELGRILASHACWGG